MKENPTLSSPGAGFRVEDRVEYDQERDAIESALFGTVAPLRKIGRFTVLERIGQGGMGTVYAAYDDRLDRKVAVKVLRNPATTSPQAYVRLLREAQAMAKLSHPNVVSVHEVGEHEGGVFVAMEFVQGQSLDRWLHAQQESRSWREVVGVFREAGRGLAAAHQAGIVHRDFKPHNVIRGDDGSVQVLDFGLARAVGERVDSAESETPAESESESESETSDDKITRTGAVLGTPAYMAPEQWQGKSVGAAGDQYSFCVALYEGLFGQRPYDAQTPVAMLDAVLDGRIREPPSTTRVPGWVTRAVMRGLATDPAQRHPSMLTLVDLLGRDPAAVRRRWWRAGGLAAAVGTASVVVTLAVREPPHEPCSGVAQSLSATVDDARMERAEAAVLATGLSYAADTWARVQPTVDDYARRWMAHRVASCQAHEDGRMSTRLFDRATACLVEGRHSLDALLGALESADASVVEGATRAVARLPILAACVDERRLSAALPESGDPAVRAQVEHQREQVARARMLHATGRDKEADVLLDEAWHTADALEQSVLLAEVELARGTVAQDAWDAETADARLSRAITLALSMGHAEVAAEAVARRMHVRGTIQYRLDEAMVDVEYGRALLDATPGARALRWLFLNNAGTVYDERGEDDLARLHYERALVAARGDAEPESLELVFTRMNLAQLDVEHHRFAQGIAAQREALPAIERLYGPRHPMAATILYILANTLSESGAVTESEAVVARALAVEEASRGDVDPVLLPPLLLSAKLANRRRAFVKAEAFARRGLSIDAGDTFFTVGLRHALGEARIGAGAVAQGLAEHRAALSTAQRVFSEQPARAAWAHQALARALLRAAAVSSTPGVLDEARTHAEAALALREGDDSGVVELAAALLCGAQVALARGERAEVDALVSRLVAELRDSVPPQSPLLAELWALRGRLAEARQQWAKAQEAFNHAAQNLVARCDPDDPELAEARFARARTLAEMGDLAAAQRTSAQALASFSSLAAPFVEEADAVRAWRAEKKIDSRDPFGG